MRDMLPDKASLLGALQSRVTAEAWERVDEGTRETITLIIRARCSKTIEGGLAEFAELLMRTPPKKEPS